MHTCTFFGDDPQYTNRHNVLSCIFDNDAHIFVQAEQVAMLLGDSCKLLFMHI